jgi:outer membrane protein W
MSNFDEDLKNRFEGVEFKPSDQLWEGIETTLLAKKKKNIFFYWHTYGIAAGLALLLTVGLLLKDSFSAKKVTTSPLAKEQPKDQNQEIITPVIDSTGNQKPTIMNQTDKLWVNLIDESKESNDQKVSFGHQAINSFINEVASNQGLKTSLVRRTSFDDLGLNSAPVQFLEYINYIPPLVVSMSILKARWEAKNLVEPMKITSNVLVADTKFERVLALNGGIGSGNFDPNSSGNALQANSQLQGANIGANQNLTSLISNGENIQAGALALGVGFDLAFSSKWSLNAGLRYTEYRFDNTSNAYSKEGNSLLPIYLPAGYQGDLVIVSNYNITNNVTSLAIPLQLSYQVLAFGKFDVDLRAGLSLDYFINYKIESDLPILDTRSIDFAQSNLFNRVNLGGVAGLGFNYRLNEQWGLTADFFARQYMKGLNDLTGFSSSPFIYGFGFNLRYFIKNEDD